ncbi:MAG: phosphate-starvation-inducible PsiE family protein [Euryarchaeota archaeon]|nr:phosphate-starvation-inducible PsiE family protein [Euryarchaeota archaeon]
MLEYVDKIERGIYFVLMGMLILVVIISVTELGWMLISSLVNEPVYLLETHGLLNFFEFFLLILIGIELLETLKTYIRENTIHVEIVVILAIIAVSRKVIVMDLNHITDVQLIGLGVILFALSAGYYLIKKADKLESDAV